MRMGMVVTTPFSCFRFFAASRVWPGGSSSLHHQHQRSADGPDYLIAGIKRPDCINQRRGNRASEERLPSLR